jgi:hypothetical protein
MTHKNTNKRDKNEPEIVKFWRSCGAEWIPMQPGQGFDGLLIDVSGLYIVEIKNSKYAWELTEAESLLSQKVQKMGSEYHVIQSIQDAARLIGLDVDEADQVSR